MIDVYEAMKSILPYRNGDMVVPTEMAVSAWAEVTENPELDIPNPAMGKGSSIGLGLALACPDRRVIVWDGDGGLLMNLGSLITIADQAPKNLYHFVLDNEMYATTGGQPVPNAGEFSFAGIARECGYPKVYEFTDIDSWRIQLDKILFQDGPVMIVFKSLPLMPDWSKLRKREIKSSAWIAHNSID